MLKAINTTNQRSSQAKSFYAVSVAGGGDTKAFDITVNVFNVYSTFGNHSVINLFPCGQFVLFRSLDGKSAVLVQSKNTQISFVISLSAFKDELAQVRTQKKEFQEQMDGIIPWSEWIALIQPCYYEGERGNKSYGKIDASAVYTAKSL